MRHESKSYLQRLAATRRRDEAWCPKRCGYHVHRGSCEGHRRENEMLKAMTLRFAQTIAEQTSISIV